MGRLLVVLKYDQVRWESNPYGTSSLRPLAGIIEGYETWDWNQENRLIAPYDWPFADGLAAFIDTDARTGGPYPFNISTYDYSLRYNSNIGRPGLWAFAVTSSGTRFAEPSEVPELPAVTTWSGTLAPSDGYWTYGTTPPVAWVELPKPLPFPGAPDGRTTHIAVNQNGNVTATDPDSPTGWTNWTTPYFGGEYPYWYSTPRVSAYWALTSTQPLPPYTTSSGTVRYGSAGGGDWFVANWNEVGYPIIRSTIGGTLGWSIPSQTFYQDYYKNTYSIYLTELPPSRGAYWGVKL